MKIEANITMKTARAAQMVPMPGFLKAQGVGGLSSAVALCEAGRP